MEEKRQLTPADKAKCKWTQEEEYYRELDSLQQKLQDAAASIEKLKTIYKEEEQNDGK